ncbi:unnamed protein product [Leptosia nina]|uniref:Sulfotransferase domain-containing protein n=1 Tax=Leptosia nina TaxID=320188 RepID=A0AAV1JTM7_9NEOP
MSFEERPTIVDVDQEITKEIHGYTKMKKKYVWVGPELYFYPDTYRTFGPKFYEFAIRPTDIFLVAHPRTGTTWVSEMIWLLNNNLNYAKAKNLDIDSRFPLLDLCLVLTPESEKERLNRIPNEMDKQFLRNLVEPTVNKIINAPSPRLIKTHLPFSLLPPTLLDTTKVVYLIRDPRDVIVSMYHIGKLRFLKDDVDFATFWSLFRRGLVTWSPIFSHLKEAWRMRVNSNMLFLKFEELSANLPGSLRRLANFFGKSYSDDQIQSLSKHLGFDEFKKNSAVNQSQGFHKLGIVNEDYAFIRKGKVGDWRTYFTDELKPDVDKWMSDNMKNIDPSCLLYTTEG